jgi:hypothetical protein
MEVGPPFAAPATILQNRMKHAGILRVFGGGLKLETTLCLTSGSKLNKVDCA